MASDSSTVTEGGSGGGNGNSYSQRSSLPWAQVVRGGGEPEAIAPRSPSAASSSVMPEQNCLLSDQLTISDSQTEVALESSPEGFECSNNENAGGVKKSAWNKSSANGGEEGSNATVMGAASWPALSELTRPLPKSSLFQSESSSSKSTSDEPVTVSQAPVISQPPRKSVKSYTARQRSMRRGEGVPPPPPPMPPYPLLNMPYGAFVPAVLDSSVRDQSPYNGNGFVPTRSVAGVGSHSHAVSDYPSHRKRNNVGPRPHGDRGPYLNNGHGGRRDSHDGDWRGPRSPGVIPHLGAPPPPPPLRGYMQQAHLGPAPFIAPPPIRPFGAPMGYEMASRPPFVFVPTLPPESYMGAPLFPHVSPPSVFVPGTGMEPSLLCVPIQRQIEYYFSDANLVRDNFLRSNMDEEGWVPVSLIAGFRRVQKLTSDLQLILNSLRDSTVVEVQGETVRRRNEWRKWVKPSVNFPPDSSFQSPRASTDDSNIETSLEKLRLHELTITDRSDTHNKEGTSNIDSVGWTDSSKLANSEVTPGDQYVNPESSTSLYQDFGVCSK